MRMVIDFYIDIFFLLLPRLAGLDLFNWTFLFVDSNDLFHANI